MICVPRKSNLADHLFGYALGRILAQRFGYALCATPIPEFPGTFARWTGAKYLNATRRWVGHWPMEEASGRALEEAELRIPPAAPVTLVGGFQRYELIAECREQIRRDWYAPSEGWLPRPADELVVCLDFRVPFGETAFEKMEARALSRDAVIACCEYAASIPHRALHVVYHGERDTLPKEVAALNPEVMVPESEWDELRFVASFQKAVIRPDALQWWATFLGAGREIHFPRITRGPWSRPARARLAHEPSWYGIDLRVPDDERYVYPEEAWACPTLPTDHLASVLP
jgi:hypothetical protein